MLGALTVMVLRSLLPCHDDGAPAAGAFTAATPTATAIDRLIAASMCLTGGTSAGDQGTPLAPGTEAPPACLHCASGCQTGSLAFLSVILLAFAHWRALPSAVPPGTAAGHAPWPGRFARGPPVPTAT